MKKVSLLFLCLVLSTGLLAQVITNYQFAASSGTFNPLSGANNLPLSGGTVNDGYFNTIPIGFPFVYRGTVYQYVCASTNGWLAFATTVSSDFNANNLSTGGARPVVAPLWDNLDLQTASNFSFLTTGAAPNRIFTAEWLNVKWGTAATGNTISFQAKLYETSGKVEFIYRQEPAAVVSGSASIGITATLTGSGNFLSLDGTGTSPNASSTVSSNGLSAKPATGQVYAFTPPAAPTAPSTLTFTSVTSSSMTLNWADNSSDETGFAIFRSPDGTNFTHVTTEAAGTTTYNAIGLLPGVTYTWRIYAVNEGAMSTVLEGSQATTAAGTVVSAASGNWSDPLTWTPNAVPVSADNVTITDGHTVIIDATAVCNSLLVGQGVSGILRFGTTAVTMTVSNGVTVASGAVFDAGAPGGATLSHQLNIGGTSSTGPGTGSLTVNGTFDMFIGAANGKASVVFSGIPDAVVSGTGPVCDFNSVTLNKGNVTATPYVTPPILEVQRNFTVTGSATTALVSSHGSGVLKIGGTFTQSNPLYASASYTIPAIGGVWISNANFTVSAITGANTGPTVNGLLKISGGTMNVGSAGTSYLLPGNGATFYIEGGTLSVSGRFGHNTNLFFYSQSGGVLRAGAIAGYNSATYQLVDMRGCTYFVMSGGTIEIQSLNANASGYEWGGPAGAVNITAGTLQLGNGASGSSALTFEIMNAAPNLTINSSSANHNVLLRSNLTLFGDLIMNGTGSFSLGTTFNLDMRGCSSTNPGNITSSGTLTLNSGSGQSLTFSGSYGNQSVAGTGAVAGNSLPGLTINNSYPSGTVTLPTGLNLNGGTGAVTPSLNLANGTLVAPSLTLTTGTTGFSVTRTNGFLQNTPVFSFTTTPVNYIYNGSVAQVSGPELPASISGTLTLNNPAGLTLNALLSAGKLTLSTGTLATTSANLLTITGTLAGDVAYTAGQVSGPMARTLPASLASGSTYLYPLGKSAYRPLELVNPLTSGGGSVVIQAEVFDADCGGTAGTTMVSLNTDRYWEVAATSGGANLTSTQLRLTETGLTTNHGIAKSAAKTGVYELASVNPPSGNTLVTGVMTSLSFYAVGIKRMNYVSSTVTQTNLNIVRQASTDNEIIGIQVVTSGNITPVSLTQFTLGTVGSTNVSDITNVRVYYTGTSPVFATTTLFGTYAAPPVGYYILNGSQTLAEGTNYFWVTYDVDLNAGHNDYLDAECTYVLVAGSNQPTTISAPSGSRQIKAALTGTVTVGSGGTYITLTGPGGVFEAINQGGMKGNTTVQILSNITEPGTHALNQWIEAGGSNYTLTVAPNAAVNRILSNSYAGALIRLNGADRVSFDGRYMGSGKYLTINNTASSGTISAIQVISLGTGQGATDVTIRNCNVISGHNGASSYAITAGGSTIGNAGDDNDNLAVMECNISKAYYGIYAGASATGVNNNLIVSGNSIGSAVATDYIIKYGLYVIQSSGAVISDNTVFNLISSTLTTSPTGMYLGAGVVNSAILRNNINGIKYTGTTSSVGGVGMMVLPGSATSNLTIANNLLYDISGTGANGPGSTSIAGIVLIGLSGGVGIFYNSVYLSGAISRSAAGADKSMALYINSGTSNLSVKNNIFMNTLENTTGTSLSYAIYSAAGSSSYTDINNNDYYAAGPEGILGFLGSNRSTIAQWRAATGQDAQSLNSDPIFASTTNLRCDYSSPVFLAGAPVPGITADYENIARDATTPTIGAYETGIDGTGPSYIYTPLGNTTSLLDRTLAVTISDYTGVPSSGSGLPVLYWRINSGSWTPATATYVSPGQYTFTFGSGAVTNDIVSYYIVGQDLVAPPNISASPAAGAAGFTSDPPACSTPPATPNSYLIAVALTGAVTVGTAGDYPNLTGNTGLFKMINDNVLTGDLTVSIISDLTEDGTNPLYQWYEEGTGNYTVTIQPDGTTERLIAGNTSQGMIRFNGADRVSVDGRNGGSGRYLRFRNSSTASPTFHLLNDASGITLRNCYIEGAALGSATAVILIGTTTGTTGNDNNFILENMIRDCSDAPGVPSRSVSSIGTAGKDNSGNTISGNEIINFASYGVILGTGNGMGWMISDNHFYNTLATPPNIAQYVIYISTGINPCSHVISGNYIGGQAPYCGGPAWENTGVQTFCGIYVSAAWDDPNSIQGNTITNITLSNTSAGSFNGIWAADGKCDIGTITGNAIGSADVATTITSGTTLGTAHIYGILISSDEYINNVENNMIRNLLLTGDSGSPDLIGIIINAANCRKNIITGLGTTQPTMEPWVYGIYNNGLLSAFGEFSNNVIALDAGASGNPEIAGYYDNTYNNCTYTFYYNSISITGQGTPWTTYAFYRGSSATYDLQNNVFSHTRGNNGSNDLWAMYFSSPGNLTSDYNDIYCPNGFIGYYSGFRTTLAEWQAGTGQDANSISADAVFADPLADLQPDLSSPLVNGGTPLIDVDIDIQNNPRSLTTPTIGAYENARDARGPVIVFTPLKNTTSTAARTLTASITDDTGIPTSGTGLPVLYWMINYGSWTAATATSLGSNQYEFSFGSGVVLGDQVSYYVVAQDMQGTPLVSVNPSSGASGFSVDPPACTTPPTTPHSYKIGAALSGTIPVGTSQACLNLTGNTGLFRLINDNVLTGDLTATITSDLTEEGIHGLNNWAEEGTGNYTLTIKPAASATPFVAGSIGHGLIRFNGADRVVIDGSNNGSDTRDLTFENNSTDVDPYVIHFGSVNSVPFNDIVFKNCIVIGNDFASSSGGAGIVVSGILSSEETGYFDNVTIKNNAIQKSWEGIYLRGGTTPSHGSNVTIQDNDMTAAGVSALRYFGIYMQGVTGATVSGNLLGNFDPYDQISDIGIWIASGCNGIDVHTNRVFNLAYNDVGGYGASGIWITTERTNADINIFNNLIENLTGDGFDHTVSNSMLRNPVGILAFASQSGINIHFNTINLFGNFLDQAGAMSCGIFLGIGSSADLRNNIIYNHLGLLSTNGYGACAVMAEASETQFAAIDHNDYSVSLTGPGTAAIGKISSLVTAITLGDWQTATGGDANSLDADPLFVSVTDLHPQEPSLEGAGVTIAGITVDYDGVTRDSPPDIGAYELPNSTLKTWDGSESTDWNNVDNWTPAGVPLSSDNVVIPAGTPNACLANATGLTCKDITIYSGATVSVDAAADISVNGNLTIQDGASLNNAGLVKIKRNLVNLNTN